MLIDSSTTGFCRVIVDGVQCFYLNDPLLIETVLATRWPEFRKEFGYKKSRDFIQRDLFSPATIWPDAKEFARASSVISNIITVRVQKARGKIDDLYAWCRSLTMEIFLRTILAGSVEPSVSQNELENATMQAIEVLGKTILRFPQNIDSVDDMDIRDHEDLKQYSKLFRDDPQNSCATSGRAITTVLAGYEQMASIMFWLFVHCAERPMSCIPGVGSKHYLNEVIRLHSPIWTIMRRPKHDLIISECSLPRGCVVITSPWLMARKAHYFPNPEEFLPERWNGPIEPFAFFPFSRGPRACKGELFVRSALYALLEQLKEVESIVISGGAVKGHRIRVSATPVGHLAVNIR